MLEDLADKVQESDAKYVVLTLDEMKIKEDLVYNKHTANIIGYINLGNTEQQLLTLEQEDKGGVRHLATHMLQFMVRGICMKLDYPVAHFATSKLSSEQMYPMVWDVVGQLESIGLKVMMITADGASHNRKFFRMHREASGNNVANGVVFKTKNIYAPERYVYFISDVPHLIKTTRNCWEKSRFGGTRLMQVRLHESLHYIFLLCMNNYYIWKSDCILHGMHIPAERRPLHFVEPSDRTE